MRDHGPSKILHAIIINNRSSKIQRRPGRSSKLVNIFNENKMKSPIFSQESVELPKEKMSNYRLKISSYHLIL